MSVIGKAKHFAIGIGVVCLLIAGGFVGYGGMPPVAAEPDIPPIPEHPPASRIFVEYVTGDGVVGRETFYVPASTHFWYNYRNGRLIVAVTPRYPEVFEGIACLACQYKLLAEQLPEYPVMEVFHKLLKIGHPYRDFCAACLEELLHLPRTLHEPENPSSLGAEVEPLWWWPRHISSLSLRGEWFDFFSETNILWPGMPACYMYVRSDLRRDMQRDALGRIIPWSGHGVDWIAKAARNTRRIRIGDEYPTAGLPSGDYITQGHHRGTRTGHDEWNTYSFSAEITWP